MTGTSEIVATAGPARPSMRAGAAWLAGGYAARSLGFLALTLLLSRALGPAGYGDIGVFLALGTGIGYLAGSWPFLAVPILVAQGTEVAAALRPAFLVATYSALALSLGVIPLSLVLLDGAACVAVVIYAAGLIGVQALTAVLQSTENMRGIAALQTAERLVTLGGAALVAVLLGLVTRSAEFALAGSIAATALVGGAAIQRRVPLLSTPRAATRVTQRQVLDAVGPFAVVMAGAYAVAWIDLFVLTAFRSREEVGTYTLSYQIYTFVYQISAMWITVSLPRHLRQSEAGVRSPAELLRPRLLAIAALGWAAGVTLGAVVAAALYEPLFGAAFRGGVGPLIILLAGACVLPLYMATAPVYMALGETRMLARLGVTAALLNVGLDLALIPWIGQWGAAVATAATMTYMVVVLLTRATSWRTTARLYTLPAILAAACAYASTEPGRLATALPAIVFALLALAAVAWHVLARKAVNAEDAAT